MQTSPDKQSHFGTRCSEDLDCLELMDSLEGGVLLLDDQGRIQLWNRWFAELTGIGSDSALNRTLEQVFEQALPDALTEAVENACRLRMSRILSWQMHKKLLPLSRRLPSGELQPVYQSIMLRPQTNSDLTLLQCVDITYAVKREKHLRASERILKLERKVLELIAASDSLEHILDTLCSTAEKLIPHSTTAVFLSNERGEELAIKSAPSLHLEFTRARQEDPKLLQDATCGYAALRQTLAVCPDVSMDVNWAPWRQLAEKAGVAACWAMPIIAPKGETLGVFAVYPCTTGSPSDQDRQLLERIAHLASIAVERNRQMERIRYLAMHDPLTGLANRSLLNEHLSQTVHRAEREQHQFALLFIDLDGFKQVNDQHGHDAGDDLLKVMASRLTQQLRGSDICARIGGDEFVVILETLSSPDAAEGVALKVLRSLSEPVVRGNLELMVSASIGLAIFPDDATSADGLLTQADDAMYKAKALGKHRVHRLSLQ